VGSTADRRIQPIELAGHLAEDVINERMDRAHWMILGTRCSADT